MQVDYNQKVLVVDSPIHGKDKIGRVPLGQAFIPSPPLRGSDHSRHPSSPTHSLSPVMSATDSIASRFRLSTRPKKTQDVQDTGHAQGEQPPVPPKDTCVSLVSTPTSSQHNSVDLSNESPAYAFRPSRLGRTMSITSINSLSRLSFSSQISQLTSIALPDADGLSGSIAAISTSAKVARTLIEAASQIQSWMSKATDVLDGLHASGDAEWAAAAGRDGVGEVDGAIKRFERLIQVYIAAVEDLQARPDVAHAPADDMKLVVAQLEKIVEDWHKIKNNLTEVKKQVELALEWDNLRDSALQEIGAEIQALSRQIFEMEERRHMTNVNSGLSDAALSGVDIGDLETIVEEAPGDPSRMLRANASPVKANALVPHDDTNLLGLFAQMQPLRAHLDFLPMRFAGFQNRARKIFPQACEDLDQICERMEEQWKRLEGDAESLRRELGEDRWILVFRNAGKQAMKMIDSVGRAIAKLDETLDSNTKLRHSSSTMKKVENYEAKKLHYCPAIERVIGIVDRGVKDRLTVNGEILRLQHDLQMRYQTIKTDIRGMDGTLDTYEKFSTQQLRDSVSSILSSDPSFLSSNIDTPGSSSASSIHTPDRRLSGQPPLPESLTPYADGKPRQLSSSSTSSKPYIATASDRVASSPMPGSSSRIPRKTPVTRSSAADLKLYARGPFLSPTSLAPASPTSSIASSRQSLRSSPASANKPRWNGSVVSGGNHFPYEHPHPGRPPTPPSGKKRISSLNSVKPPQSTPSSKTATPLSSRRISRPPSALTATPSPHIKRTSATPTPSLAQSWGPSTTGSLPYSHISSIGEEPSSPSPVRPASAIDSRPGSSLSGVAKRGSLLPQPATTQRAVSTPNPRVAPGPGPYAQRPAPPRNVPSRVAASPGPYAQKRATPSRIVASSPGPYAQRFSSESPDAKRFSGVSNASRSSAGTVGTVRR